MVRRFLVTGVVVVLMGLVYGCGQEATPGGGQTPGGTETPAVRAGTETVKPPEAPPAAPVQPVDPKVTVLLDFEDGKNPFTVDEDFKDKVEMVVVNDPDHATSGTRSLKVTLKPHEWPGIHTTDLPADWSGYESLTMDILVLQDFDLNIRIDDVNSADYETRFNSPPQPVFKGKNTITVYLSDVGQFVDLKKVKGLYVFSSNVESPLTFYVDRIRLEKKK